MKQFLAILMVTAVPTLALAANETVVIKAEPIQFNKTAQKKTVAQKVAAATPAPLAAPAAGAVLPPPPPPPAKSNAAAKTAVAPAPAKAAAKAEVKTETKAAAKTTVKPAAKTEAKKVSVKPAATAKVDPAPATKKAPAQVSAANDSDELKRMNKKFLLDFLHAAKGGTLGTFYKSNPQFSRSVTEEQFVRKFEQYSALDDDTVAIEANDFANTTITDIKDNKRYKSCQMVEAKSKVDVQIVQDAHKYSITNKYCRVADGFKLVSFKFGYEE